MCRGPAWKREVVPDHKFDFVDTREFNDNGFIMRMKYLWLYILVLKSFLVYISDIFSAITMLTTTSWHQQVFNDCPHINGCFAIPFKVGQWLFVGCILFSFVLLAYESRKTKRIIASRDISYAFTNVMANYYYSLRSYNHFCFFEHISDSTKLSDDFAFFVFFVFKSWKRLLLADAPRQIINALTLWAIYLSKKERVPGSWWDVRRYFGGSDLSAQALMVTTSLTVIVFAGSMLILIVAGICYVPLLCYIRGNLKEYCCHIVDKRIDMVIKRKQKQRLADAAKFARNEARGDFTHLRNKKGEMIAQPLPQPTLPNVSVDDDFDDNSSYTRVAPSNYADSKSEYPPMPAYQQPYSTHQEPGAYAYFNRSQVTLDQQETYPPQPVYESDVESAMYMPATGTAYSQQPPYGSAPPYANSVAPSYVADPHDVYQGRARTAETARRSPPASSLRPPSVGLAYDDIVSEYTNPEYESHANPSGYGHHSEPSYSSWNQSRPTSNEAPGPGGGSYAM